jgi:GNAT superfamily N-acetyltransferase
MEKKSFDKNLFSITTDYHKINKNKVYELLSQSYWANTRDQEIIDESLKNSLCFSLFFHDDQIGILRVITDYSTFAYLCDFIIDEKFRNQGLGGWLLNSVLNHQKLKKIKRWILITKDAHEFYRKFEFTNLNFPDKYMEKIIK